MRWLIIPLVTIILTACNEHRADLIATGLLVGTNCPGVVYLRGGIKLDSDCIVVIKNEAKSLSYPVDKSYVGLIGRNVAVISIKKDINVVTPIQ